MTLRKKGFSLIEVVIALAIFVIGALAVIRIFPTGLSLVEKSGNEQLAANLNRSIVARRLNTKSVPDGIFNGGFEGADTGNYQGTWLPFDGAVSGSAQFNKSLPKGIKSTELSGSALDRFQAIRGEKSVVRESTSGQYILTQSSISPTRTAAVYREFTVENVKVAANGVLDWTSANKVGSSNIFNPLDTTATPPIDLSKLTFYATYRYKEGTRIWGMDEEAIPAAATTLPSAAFTAPRSVVPGLIEVKARQFLQTADFTATDGPAKALCGLIEVTSTGATNGITLGETVSVDYVTNWYWILEETTSPTSVDTNLFGNLDPDVYRQVELSLPFVRPRSSQRFATLIMSNGGIGEHYASTYDGNFIPAATKVFVPADSSNFRAALREGKIVFNITSPPPAIVPPQLPAIASPIIRVAYRTQDDWAEQLSVSAKTYLRNSDFTTWNSNAESWRNYELEGNFLVFQPSEAGKSIRVTYNYDSAAGSGTRTELIAISSEITAHLPLQVARATIVPPNSGTVTSILSVRGASITSRTAWMTNDRYNHNLLTSIRSDS